jgi:predicted HTH transcriptional regulator
MQTNEINAEMIDYMTTNGKVSAKELSELVGITVSSIRYRLFQLMGRGIVSQEKTRNYRVWFFVVEKEKEAASRANSKNGNTTIQNRRIDNVNSHARQ